jgi:glutaredoxin-like protein
MKNTVTLMGFIPDEHKQHIKEDLEKSLLGEVKIIVFTQEIECQLCKQTRELVQEVGGLSEKIKVEVYDFVKDAEKVKEFNIDKVPAIVVMGQKDYRIRFFGIPLGYEFKSFFDSIINVSRGETGLSEETKKKLATINKPIHIQVFVSLTCPYCPLVVELAHKFAMESDFIRADCVEVGEFPHLAQKYSVMGVPKTIINEKTEMLGVIPETVLLEQLLHLMQEPTIYI